MGCSPDLGMRKTPPDKWIQMVSVPSSGLPSSLPASLLYACQAGPLPVSMCPIANATKCDAGLVPIEQRSWVYLAGVNYVIIMWGFWE